MQRHRGTVPEGQAAVAAIPTDERGDEVGGGRGQDAIGGVVLLQDTTGTEDGDAVTETHGLVDVVRDEDDGLLDLRLQAQHLVLEVLPHHGIDRAEGLVHQQDRRIGGERASDPDTLLLTARQLCRVPRGERGVQAHAFENGHRLTTGLPT